jgi:hypothetical protein
MVAIVFLSESNRHLHFCANEFKMTEASSETCSSVPPRFDRVETGVENQMVRSVRFELGLETLNVSASPLIIICRETMKIIIVGYIPCTSRQHAKIGQLGSGRTDMFGWNHSKPKSGP